MAQERSQTKQEDLDTKKEYQDFLHQLAILEKEKEKLLNEYKEALEKRKIEQLRKSIKQEKDI